MGACSRSEAARRIADGRVSLNGKVVRDAAMPADPSADRIEMDGVELHAAARVCIAINKPRGLVVSAADEQGRNTIYSLLRDSGLPWLGPVGRLDKASEGLLLMGNDPAWAAGVTGPSAQVTKTYRVQVQGVPDATAMRRLGEGIVDRGERLSTVSVRTCGGGEKNTWLEIVLDEGRNRHIRRMLEACGHDVLRLLRVAIGTVQLGDLPKGGWRMLTGDEIEGLSAPPPVGQAGAAVGRVRQPAARRRSRFPSPANPHRPR